MNVTLRSLTLITVTVVISLAGRALSTKTTPANSYRNAESTQQDSAVFRDGSVSYRGVRFSYNSRLASEVKAETIPAAPASAQEPVPADTVYPEHTVFEFAGTYGGRPESFIKSEIRVYPVADY